MPNGLSIGQYLIRELSRHGVNHIFGVPGDYILSFYGLLQQSEIQIINTCDEQGAGFAADAYARVKGLGAVCVTYCVGGLKIANTTAQAFAEKSPVVVICGSPGTKERDKNPLLHHKVREFDTQLKVFEQLTVASTVLNDAETACREIDRVLTAAIRYRRPVYIEIPRDMVNVPAVQNQIISAPAEASDPDSLRECVHEAVQMINGARKPVIIAGVELHRFGLQEIFLSLIEKTNIPVASTLLSKSVISELHPRYLGLYEGAMGREDIRDYVESSDCLILLGALLSDVDLGIYTAHMDPALSIYVTSEKASIRYHKYEGVLLQDFIQGLLQSSVQKRVTDKIPHPELPPIFRAVSNTRITIERLYQRLNSFLDDNTAVIADPGDALFAGADLVIHSSTEFLSPSYYTSMGYAVPASLGVQTARPDLRPLVLVGDGAFQMTGMELSTAARFGLNPIVVVLNNGGYGTERPMLDGPFNNIGAWDYSVLPKLLNTGRGFSVQTEGDLEQALTEARNYKGSFYILDVKLDPSDTSAALKRLTGALAKRVHAS